MAFCNMCGAQIADGTQTCAACSSRMAAAAAGSAPPPQQAMAAQPATAAGGMTDNVAGMLAYFTPIPSVMFLVMEPYNRSRFVRFHAWQNIFFCVGLMAVWIGYVVVAKVLHIIPILGALLGLLLWAALFFGQIIVWLILLIKANGGQMWKLPFIGDLAEKQANAM